MIPIQITSSQSEEFLRTSCFIEISPSESKPGEVNNKVNP